MTEDVPTRMMEAGLAPDAMFHPRTEWAFSVAINLNRPYQVRPSLYGKSERWAVYLKDGKFWGPEIRGEVVPFSGADWPIWREDGVIDFDARYILQTDDGATIYMQNRGYRWAEKAYMEAMSRNEEVPFDKYYMRVAPKFEAPAGKYEWLAKHVFVGVAEKVPRGNCIHYFKVL